MAGALYGLIRRNRAPDQLPADAQQSGILLDAPAAWYKNMLWIRNGRLILDRTHLRFVLRNGKSRFDIPRASIDSIRWSPFGPDLPTKKSAEFEVTVGRERHRVFLLTGPGGMGLFGDEGRKALAPWKAALSPALMESEAGKVAEDSP